MVVAVLTCSAVHTTDISPQTRPNSNVSHRLYVHVALRGGAEAEATPRRCRTQLQRDAAARGTLDRCEWTRSTGVRVDRVGWKSRSPCGSPDAPQSCRHARELFCSDTADLAPEFEPFVFSLRSDNARPCIARAGRIVNLVMGSRWWGRLWRWGRQIIIERQAASRRQSSGHATSSARLEVRATALRVPRPRLRRARPLASRRVATFVASARLY